ncbi:hypothetical protein [Vibrio sp. D431a]|uniref:hypothetical protein n=1 Tax=Vibrio sp. D431a TaxID=2837388 RepID=UPI0025561C68|nr:hypothetical protein [Vibrio sp. D431a]MDK9793296.1 hypothetical protein [Vibrio sp. D431a]
MNHQSKSLKLGYGLIILSYIILLPSIFLKESSSGLATILSTLMGVFHLVGIVAIWFAKRKATEEELKHCHYIIKAFWIYNIAGAILLGISIWAAMQVVQLSIDPVTNQITYAFVENKLMSGVTAASSFGLVLFSIWYLVRTVKGAYFYYKNKELNFTVRPSLWLALKAKIQEKFKIKSHQST